MSVSRIGVFVCHCGNNIGGVVDVPQVVEYSKTLPNVVHAEDNLYACSEDGLLSIRNKIKECDLDRVVVAACTPRTHEPLFRDNCAAANLNRYLFEFVNIREQCSWIHMKIKLEATEKAKELVRMGVAKANLLEPQQEFESQVYPSALVIGGGVAGMSAALSLANQGFKVHLVEKKALGGLLLNINRIFPTNEEAERLIQPIINQVKNHPNIRLHMPAVVDDVKGYVGNFHIVTRGEGQETEFEVGTIIVATGAEELRPDQYGYGRMPNVITQLELEQRLKREAGEFQKVVMINCVGARVPERPYCSRFCCLTAIKNATLIKENHPRAEVYLLHNDLMTYGVAFEEYYLKARESKVRFVRYALENPPQILGDEKAEAVKVYDELMGEELELPCNIVVLTVPLVPGADNQELSKRLKVPLGDGGFFLEAHLKLRPQEFTMDGVYVCGCARWPSDIPDSVAQGLAAAAKAAIPMKTGSVKTEAITAFVDRDACVACGSCVLVCPFNAIEIQVDKSMKAAQVNAALCKGCGSCVATCPSKAVQQRGFTDQQLLSMIAVLAGRS